MDKKPTKDMIKRTLQASQMVWLAKGYSSVNKFVFVSNYTEEYPGSIHFPEFGNWKTFVKIKNELRKAIDKEFPQEAFPYRVVNDYITLWQRNPYDMDYIKEIGTFRAIENTEED